MWASVETVPAHRTPDDLQHLQRWIDSGGYFAVRSRRGAELTLALLTCDGGEEMGRIVSVDPAVAAWCAAHGDVRADGC